MMQKLKLKRESFSQELKTAFRAKFFLEDDTRADLKPVSDENRGASKEAYNEDNGEDAEETKKLRAILNSINPKRRTRGYPKAFSWSHFIILSTMLFLLVIVFLCFPLSIPLSIALVAPLALSIYFPVPVIGIYLYIYIIHRNSFSLFIGGDNCLTTSTF